MDDETTRLQIRLRLARFRLDGASLHGPEWEAAAGEVEALEAAREQLGRPGAGPADDAHPTEDGPPES